MEPKAWNGIRNPVRYVNLADIGIDESSLDLKPMIATPSKSPTIQKECETEVGELTIEKAKALLAKKFGVDPTAVEITIRY